MEYGSLQEFLLQFVLTSAGAGVILFFILDKLPYVDTWFASLGSAAKRLTVLVLSLVIPLAGAGLAIGLGYIEFSENVIYAALQVGFTVFTGSQVAHTFSLGKG